MANALALATVTASLRAMLDYALSTNEQLAAAISGGVTVTALPPERAASGSGTRLNVTLFRVAPNTGARSGAGMGFQAEGGSVRPPLALDLLYLVSAYSDEPYVAEMLLGHVMAALNETPVLSRELMRNVLALPLAEETPALIRQSAAAWSERGEQLKVTPVVLPMDELASLWTACRVPYTPTIAYAVSAVMI